LSAGTTSANCYVNSISSLQKELKECISEVERIEDGVNSSKKKEWLKIKEEKEEEKHQEEEEAPAITLDSYFINNNANYK
jgi:hypothetical protein